MISGKIFYPGIDICPMEDPMGFRYGPDCFGPLPEIRKLDSIRASLLDPDCDGPEDVYAIAMDVGKKGHETLLREQMLLFGVVTYARGRLGSEPIRSQGHIHRISAHCGWSTPEIYEIWKGSAVILMQESAHDDPGCCFAVYASPGDIVVVPPYWAHATVSADPREPLTFGAWCDRDYGFEYEEVRAHGGLAYFPLIGTDGKLDWQRNTCYMDSELIQKAPGNYGNLGIRNGIPIYTQFEQSSDTFLFVSHPAGKKEVWDHFIP